MTDENDMLGLMNTRRAGGTIGIAMDDPALVRTMARILSDHGHEIAIFNRADVMGGTWPVLPYTAVVASAEAIEHRRAAEPEADGLTILVALPRNALARHRDKIAAADGFVVTDESLVHLPRLVALAAHGLSVMPRGLKGGRTQVSPRLDRIRQLSPRDLEVLQELSLGRDNRSIARRLGMSVPTAKTHIRRIVERLGFRNRTDAAVFGAVYLAPRRPPATTLETIPARKG